MTKPHILVIGAGIAGLCTAYWLTQSGFQVTVWESEAYPAQKTSRANGSQLSACNAQVWHTWPQIKKAFKWMWDAQAPFHVSAHWDTLKWRWLMQFALEAARGNQTQHTQNTIRMAMESAQALEQMVTQEQIEFDHVKKGILHVYAHEQEFVQAQEYQELFAQAGCAWKPMDAEACVNLEPALKNYQNLQGGIYTHHDSTGDMHMFCVNLSSRLQQKWGVQFEFNKTARNICADSQGVTVDKERFDGMVLANGVWARDLAQQVGEDLMIYPVKGYSITVQLDQASAQAAPWVSMLDEATKIVCSRLGEHRLRVAGTAELCGYNWDIQSHRVAPLLNWVRSRFPDVNVSMYTPWAGLRPMTPDQMPIVRGTQNHRVWLATGFGHLGWTLSPGVTRRLAQDMAHSWFIK